MASDPSDVDPLDPPEPTGPEHGAGERAGVSESPMPNSGTSDRGAELSQAMRRISTATSVASTLETITQEAPRLIGAHQAVTSRTINLDWAQTISSIYLSERYAQWRDYDVRPDGSGIYALIAERNEPMRLTQDELEAHPAWRGFGEEAGNHPPMRGWLAAPLVGRDGSNIGLIQLSDKADGTDFTQDDENVLVQLAQVAAIAIENAQLYEAAQEARADSEQRLREAQAERQQLAEIFQNAPSFMCVLRGPEHVFERANDHYRELVGPRELIGKSVREALPEVTDQGFLELLDQVYTTGETYHAQDEPVQLRLRPDDPTREERWVDFVYQPIRDAEGTVTGIYVQGVDNTERKRIEQALRQSEQRLKKANASLEERVHERTAELEERAGQLRALAAELTRAEQRERRRLADFLHDHLQQLLVAGNIQLDGVAREVSDEQVGHTIQRVRNLLDQSIRESRSLTAELSPPVLYESGLPAALASLGRWLQAAQGLQVEIEAEDGADPIGEELRVLLFQAARELLLNVVKHAATDHAKVTVRRDENDDMEVVVADAGQGFDPKSLNALSSTQDRFGLFSLRERIAWFGGDMRIDSAPGQGTRIALCVPEQPPAGAQGLPAHASAEPVSPAAASGDTASAPPEAAVIDVVLADDHTIVREGLANALARDPEIAVVGEAANGQEAVDLTRRVRPHVVVLDITMPGMSGVEAARCIRDEFPAVRIIGLSVHEASDMAQAMCDAGAVAYLNKSEASDRLLQVIREHARTSA